MKTIGFLDMDGVLADFATAACQKHGCPTFLDRPPFRGPKLYGLENLLCGGDPEKFWTALSGELFWRTLDKTAEADAIVQLAEEFLDEIYVLTAPADVSGCVEGKKTWIHNNFSRYKRRVIFTSHKHLLAAPRRILIDDRSENCRAFSAAGGHSFLVGRPWNESWMAESANVSNLSVFLKEKSWEELTRPGREISHDR